MNQTNNTSAVLITIKEFANRISVDYSTAYDLSRSGELNRKGISVKINPEGKNGGVRIYWEKHLEHVGATPAVPDYKRRKPRVV